MAVPLQERVQEERRLLGMSVRAAAARGGVSNTTWTTWENGGELGPAIRKAVVKAFDWPEDWPENPPPSRLRPVVDEPVSNSDLLEVLSRVLRHAEYTNLALRAIAEVRGIALPAPPEEASDPPSRRRSRHTVGR